MEDDDYKKFIDTFSIPIIEKDSLSQEPWNIWKNI